MKANIVKKSFSGGEVSRDLQGRTDGEFMQNSVERMENFIPVSQGVARFRPPTFHISDISDESSDLLSFNPTDGRRFILSYETGYFVAYDQNGRIEEDKFDEVTGASIVAGTGATTTLRINLNSGHGINNFDPLAIKMKVTHLTTSVETIYSIVVSGVPGGTSIDLATNLLNQNYGILEPVGSTVEIISFSFVQAADFDISNSSTITSLHSIQAGDTLYVAYERERPVSVDPNIYSSGITSVVYNGTLARTLDGVAVSGGTGRSSVAFYEQRLVKSIGNRLEFSEAGNFANFTTGTNANDPLSYSIAGSNNNVSNIEWIQATEKFLLVGTSTGNYIVTGGSEYAPITPNSISIKPVDTFGSNSAQAIIANGGAYYAERGGRALRRIQYDNRIRGHRSLDISKLSRDITRGVIKRVSYLHTDKTDIIFCLKEDGKLVALVSDFEQGTYGWFRVKIGGEGVVKGMTVSRDVNNNDLLVLSVQRENGDSVVNSLEYLENFVEYFSRCDFYTGDKIVDDQSYLDYIKDRQENDMFLDSKEIFFPDIDSFALSPTGLTAVIIAGGGIQTGDQILEIDGPGVLTVTGSFGPTSYDVVVGTAFDNLNYSGGLGVYIKRNQNIERYSGKQIAVASEGRFYLVDVNSDGSFDTTMVQKDRPQSVEYYGFPYKGFIKTLPLESASQLGESTFKKKNLTGVFIKTEHSLGLKYGTDPYNLSEVILRKPDDVLSDQVPSFTGLIGPLEAYDDWEREKSLYFIHDKPYPMNIISYGYYVKTEEL